jgi:hypothetical protein
LSHLHNRICLRPKPVFNTQSFHSQQ